MPSASYISSLHSVFSLDCWKYYKMKDQTKIAQIEIDGNAIPKKAWKYPEFNETVLEDTQTGGAAFFENDGGHFDS